MSGKYLHPLRLAREQPEGAIGFIMVDYAGPAPVSARDGAWHPSPAGFYDLFFFRSSGVYEFGRMHPSFRAIMDIRSGLQAFSVLHGQSGAKVSVYSADEESLWRFRATFYCEPCLRIEPGSMQEGQLRKALLASGFRGGIVECGDFAQSVPSLQLAWANSAADVPGFRPFPGNRRLLLYDIQRNVDAYLRSYPDGWGYLNCPRLLRQALSRLEADRSDPAN